MLKSEESSFQKIEEHVIVTFGDACFFLQVSCLELEVEKVKNLLCNLSHILLLNIRCPASGIRIHDNY